MYSFACYRCNHFRFVVLLGLALYYYFFVFVFPFLNGLGVLLRITHYRWCRFFFAQQQQQKKLRYLRCKVKKNKKKKDNVWNWLPHSCGQLIILTWLRCISIKRRAVTNTTRLCCCSVVQWPTKTSLFKKKQTFIKNNRSSVFISIHTFGH